MGHTHEVSSKRLFLTIVLNVFITVAQVVGGILSNSLSLMSDALHNFSDVVALFVSWIANLIARKKPDTTKTFGYKRAEILAAFFNSATLIGIAILLIYHSILKFFNPEQIKSLIVIYLALLSIVLNTLSVLIVKHDAEKSMNVKSAYLHLLTDVLTSVAVFVGGIAMLFWKVYWVDPLISFVIAIYLVIHSFSLFRESLGILMQFSPPEISINDIRDFIEGFDLVNNVHHIHVWRLGEHDVFLEIHIDLNKDLLLSDVMKFLDKLEKSLNDRFGVEHLTVQVEYGRRDDKSLISDC